MKLNRYSSSSVFDSYVETLNRFKRAREIRVYAGVEDIAPAVARLTGIFSDSASSIRLTDEAADIARMNLVISGSEPLAPSVYIARYFDEGLGISHLPKLTKAVGGLPGVRQGVANAGLNMDAVRVMSNGNARASQRFITEIVANSAAGRNVDEAFIRNTATRAFGDVDDARMDDFIRAASDDADALSRLRSGRHAEAPTAKPPETPTNPGRGVQNEAQPANVNINSAPDGSGIRVTESGIEVSSDIAASENTIINIVAGLGGDGGKLTPTHVTTITDSVRSATRSIKSHTGRSVNALKQDIAAIRTTVEEIKASGTVTDPAVLSRMDDILTELDDQSTALRGLETRVGDIQVNQARAAARMDDLATKTQAEEILVEVGEVQARVQANAASLSNEIAGLGTRIDDVGTRVDDVGRGVAENSGKIDDLQESVVDLSGDLDDVGRGVAENTGKIDGLSGQVDDVATNVTSNSGKIDGLSDQLDDGMRRMDDMSARHADEIGQNRRMLQQMDDGLNRRLDELASSVRRANQAGRASDSATGLARAWGWLKTGTKIVAGVAVVAGIIYLWGRGITDAIWDFFDGDDPADGRFYVDRDPNFWIYAGSQLGRCESLVDASLQSLRSVSFSNPDTQSEISSILSDIEEHKFCLSNINSYSEMNPSDIPRQNAERTLRSLASLAAAMSRLDYIIQEGGAELRNQANDADAWDSALAAHSEASSCVQTGAEAVTRRLDSLSPAPSGPVSPGPNSRGPVRSNPDVMFDPTLGMTRMPIKLQLDSSIFYEGGEYSFVNVPKPPNFSTRGRVNTGRVRAGLSNHLNSTRGLTLIKMWMDRLEVEQYFTQIPREHVVQYAINRAAFDSLRTDAYLRWGRAGDLIDGGEDIEEALRGSGTPGGGFLGMGYKNRRRRMEREQAQESAREILEGRRSSMSERKDKIKKLALIAMDNDNNQHVSINNSDSKRNIGKKADEVSRSYYKDALTGQSGNDQYMKSYYAGLKGMYDESLDRRKADYKEHFMLHDETGEDLIHAAHPKAIVVSDAIGRGGLVENGLEQKRQSHEVAFSTPTGNYRANYAWLRKDRLKK